LPRTTLVRYKYQCNEGSELHELRYMTPLANREDLVGEREVFKTEIPNYELTTEVYGFGDDEQFRWLCDGMENLLTYKVGDGWMEYRRGSGKWIRVVVWKEGDWLVLQPIHGYLTWAKRR
jgi:hypothetical protein